VASFAVLADDSPGWRPSEYQSELLGWEHRFRFPTAKLLDHEHRLAVLQRDPKPLEQQVWQGIEDIEKKADMKYVTSVERLAIERGMAQGIEKGLEQGREQGRLDTLTRQLTRRFGPPSIRHARPTRPLDRPRAGCPYAGGGAGRALSHGRPQTACAKAREPSTPIPHRRPRSSI